MTFSTPGTKQVTLRSCNSGGCTSITKTVTVLDPMPRITGMSSVPPLLGTGQMISLSAQTAGRPSLIHRWAITGTGSTSNNLTLTGNPVVWSTSTPGIGTYEIRLEVQNGDGSVFSNPLPVSVARQSFSDVPPTYWAWQSIETLYAAGLTGGCATGPLRYCPTGSVSRAEMAAFLVKASHGTVYVPPVPTGIFADVPVDFWAAPAIEQIFLDGITSGCALAPLRYCPDSFMSRAEMAVFLLRAKHGALFIPPPATGTVFADVPADAFAAAWIEQLASEGLTGGCATDPVRYCPDSTVSRDQMAVFLVRTFNLTAP
ncbi:MAG TPA: S-layer homology domain-containing protein [Thermoanaerobaculia bacterium]|nr:S-layer homology domain-containing protein [Thermoanaerobaculia bacterium]